MSGCLNSHSSDVDNKIVVQVFDRCTDPTKGATERKRGTIQTGPSEYSRSYNIDFKKNYGETSRDRGFGRKKIINMYVRWLDITTLLPLKCGVEFQKDNLP